MPNIGSKAVAGASLVPADVVALIASILSGTADAEQYPFDPTVQTVEEEIAFGRTLTKGRGKSGDDALIGSAVDRFRLAVRDAAKRPDSVPSSHVVRSSKTVDYASGKVTVALYWGDPAHREDRTADAPVVEDAPQDAPTEDAPAQ